MLEAAGGGGGGTDWWGMSMEMIHGLSQNPDIDSQYQIVDGWQKSAELIADHMSQVQDYRDALAAAWPPAKSSAAANYLARLDGLLKNLNETYEAALANRDALSSASLSLSLAKTEVAKIYSQWDTNNKALAAFNQQQAQKQQADSGKPSPSPSPSGDEPPPVTAAQQEALRQKAITLMSGVSSDLAEAQLKVIRPTPFGLSQVVNKPTGEGGTGSGSVPVLPPIVPTSYSGGGGGSLGGSSHLSTPNSAPFPTATSPTVTSGNNGNPGLVLGGTNQPPTLTPPSIGGGPITNLPSTGGPIGSPGPLPPTAGPLVPGGNLPPAPGGFPRNGGIKPIGAFPEGSLKAMPPGGIIGKMPAGNPGEPGTTRFGTQRVNPVGGVIGESGPGGGGINGESVMSGGRGVVGARNGGSTGQMRSDVSEQPYGQAGSRRRGRRQQAHDMQWDPTDPWITEEGVDPVVLPPIEQRVDPGPAIGLR